MKSNKLILAFTNACKLVESEDILFSSAFKDFFSKAVLERPVQAVLHDILDIYKADYNRGSSLRHENGFIKISLYKSRTSSIQLRLHLWNKGVKDSNIHNHRWDFFSCCLRGNLVCQNFSLEHQGTTTHTLYSVSDADQNLKKQRTKEGLVGIRKTTEYILGEGGYHFLSNDVFHSVFSPEESISLFVSGPPISDFSNVITSSHQRAHRVALFDFESVKILSDL